MGGIENGGWRVVYNSTPSGIWRDFEEERRNLDFSYSIGMIVKEDGTVQDVAYGGPAQKAGIAPTAKVIAIDNRQFTPTVLREAVQRTAKDSTGMDLLIKSGEYYSVHRVEYHGGEKYPHLERDESKADVLSKIIEPLVKN